MHKSLAVALILSFMLPATRVLAEGDLKFAIVDLQKAIQTVAAGKKARAQLEKEAADKKKFLQGEEEAIKGLADGFKKQSEVLSESAREKKRNEIQERMAKAQETYQKFQMELQTKERQLLEPIVTKLRAIVTEIGELKKYSIIFEKNDNSVLFIKTKDDVTEDVISAFNKKNG